MQTKITGLCPHFNLLQPVDVFGYSTKGLPGLEIIGAPKGGRALKEKLIYLSRRHCKRLPMRRFVLCIDTAAICDLDDKSLQWLELPLLLLFWSLADVLPIARLEDCQASGKISVEGELMPLDISAMPLAEDHPETIKYIGSGTLPIPEGIKFLALEELVGEIRGLRVRAHTPRPEAGRPVRLKERAPSPRREVRKSLYP